MVDKSDLLRPVDIATRIGDVLFTVGQVCTIAAHHEDAARSLDGARGDRRRSAPSSGSTTPTRSST